jgi:undecaprenyl-diphosphatase
MSGWILRIGAYDRRLLHALAERRRRWITVFMRSVTHLGDAPSAIGIAGLLLLGIVPGLGSAGVWAALSLLISHGVSQILKRTISRPRPQLPVGLESLISPPDRFSFPSGHASASLSIALPVVLALPVAVGSPILLLALMVGVSRCYLGVHYPGDVLMGWGLALGAVVASGLILP